MLAVDAGQAKTHLLEWAPLAPKTQARRRDQDHPRVDETCESDEPRRISPWRHLAWTWQMARRTNYFRDRAPVLGPPACGTNDTELYQGLKYTERGLSLIASPFVSGSVRSVWHMTLHFSHSIYRQQSQSQLSQSRSHTRDTASFRCDSVKCPV